MSAPHTPAALPPPPSRARPPTLLPAPPRLLSEVTLQLEGLQQSQGGVKSAALQAAVNEVLSSCPPKLAQLSVARRAELLWKALKV